MLFSLSARQHNVIMRVVGVGVTMHHVIMVVANAPKCMFDVIVVVVVNMMHAIVVGHRKRHHRIMYRVHAAEDPS